MNRTNSVEPIFSQPLSLNYHQLLQNKTKIEDELYQTQRQLRKKEGEYKKKIAIYEQKIEQMEQQIDEFKERENSTRAMYDKILLTLNQQDKDQYQMDISKVQELLQQLSRGNSSTDTFRSKQNDIANKVQIETLEMSLQHLNESYNKLKQSYIIKDKDLTNTQRELQHIKEISKDKQEQLFQEVKILQEEKNITHQSFIEKEQSLRKQYKEDLEKFKNLTREKNKMLENKVKDLENILAQKMKQEQLIALDKSYQKENSELKQFIERLKKERENEEENWINEREQMQQQVQIQEQIICKIKKQMNNNLANNNEATKRLKQKLQESEKDLQVKNDEIQKLKNKVALLKQQNNKYDMLEKKQQLANTSQIQKENLVSKALETGKEYYNPLCDTSQITENTKKKSNFKVINRSSKNKMFGNEIVNNPILSRNSNCQSQSSISQKDQQNNNMNQRSQTPNTKQKQQLEKQIQQNVNISQVMQSQKSKRRLDEVYQSAIHTNKELAKYMMSGDQQEIEEEDENSFTPRLNKEGQRVLFTSMEIEQVVRKMIDQVKNESRQNQMQQINTSSSYSSQNVSFSQHKQKQFEQVGKANQACAFHKQNCVLIDKDFLAKLETCLKQLTKSNEKIKQIMKEKESYQKKCNKLKQKVSFLKEEKESLQRERDILMVQNQKIECKLKQAQVILNLESDPTQNLLNATIYDMPSDVSTIKKNRICETVQSQKGLTLTLTKDQQFNSRYNNPPMSCKVNDSCETSFKMTQELQQLGSQSNRNLFQQTLDKSILDQSNITLKRSQHQTNVNQSVSRFIPGGYSTTTIPSQPYQLRGKTPTLQINLGQNNYSSQGQWMQNDEDSQQLTSRILCKSTTNLIHKNHQQKQEKKTQNNFQKYSTIRESQTKLFRSPQMNKVNIHNNFNSTIGQRDRSPRQIQVNKTVSVPFMNTQKCKNRYYSRRVQDQKDQEDICDQNDIIDIRTIDQDWDTDGNIEQLIFSKDQDIIQPSDEREGEEQTVQLKLVNNTQFIPSMHARYIADE